MRALKIVGISLLSAIGLLILLVLIAMWIVFTPSRLTPIVRNNANKFISCEYELGSINLTFVKTFPKFGLEISELLIKNPVQGAQSDTLLYLEKITAEIDARALWKENELIVNGVFANNLTANLFFGEGGVSNIDILTFPTSEDEDEDEDEDSSDKDTDFNLPIDVDKVGFYELNLSYLDATTGLKAAIGATNIELNGNYRNGKAGGNFDLSSESISAAMTTDSLQLQTQLADTKLKLNGTLANNCINSDIVFSSKGVWASLNGDNYLNYVPLTITLPLEANIDNMSFNVADALLSLDKLKLQLSGDIAMGDNIEMDVDFALNELQIADIISLIPSHLQGITDGFDVDGIVAISGSALGIYNDSVMPVVNANLQLSDTHFGYNQLPIYLNRVAANVDAFVNLNNETATTVNINKLTVQTAQSSISLVGKIAEVLSDNMKIDVAADVNLQIEEFSDFLPDNILAEGKAAGNVAANLTMQQLSDMDIEAMKIEGNLAVTELGAVYADTISLSADALKLDFNIPNRNNPLLSLADVNLYDINSLKVNMGSDMYADIDKLLLNAEVSNILKDSSQFATTLFLELGNANVGANGIEAIANNLSGNANIQLNLADSTSMPMVNGEFELSSLYATMDTISANVESPQFSFSLDNSSYYKGGIGASLNWQSGFIDASMGSATAVSVESLQLAAIVAQDSSKTTPLSQWHPQMNVNLANGIITVPQLSDNILIPNIVFDMNDQRINITDGSFLIGPSDFHLSGQINNIENYLENRETELLVGELNFTSQLTDVNYFMDLTNGFGAEVEMVDEDELMAVDFEENDTDTLEEASPFIVPMGVNFALNTNIEKALVGRQECYNLGGKLYVNDGTLILEEMGFISQATELQLTAIYKSPRKNHLYLGIDYHMLNIDIDELLEMIPDIDTIMPMLKAFHGSGEFHLAAETYLNANYELKLSTLRGACSINGKDLVVLENDVFNKIKRLTLMGRKTENKIENINIEATVFRDEVDVYPLMVSMGRYQAILGGRHNLDMSYNYHISLTKSPLPVRLGINIFTKPNKGLKIRLARCRYAADYRPGRQYVVDNRQRELRQIIRESLTSGVVRE